MTFFAPENIRSVTAGHWVQRPEPDVRLLGVGTDTREDLSNCVFIAIQGEQFDGHDFLPHAVAHGARLAIVHRVARVSELPPSLGVIQVDDTRHALGRLAAAYRRTLRGTKVIAVTGSAGKTTTKNLIHAVLSRELRGTAAPKSFNNDVGVPLTILAAHPADRYLVVEIGTNAPGEIAALSKIASPDIAVITNVGRAHLAGFGSCEAIVREKASILSHLSGDELAVVNGDAQALEHYLSAVRNVIRYGENDLGDLRLTEVGRDDEHRWFQVNGRHRFDLALPGRHNALNAMAAIAIGRRFGLDDAVIGEALGKAEPEAMRYARAVVSGLTVYNDAYNANPESMNASIRTFMHDAVDAGRRILVLGDMLELGHEAATLHEELARTIIEAEREISLAQVILIGTHMRTTADVLTSDWGHGNLWRPGVTWMETYDRSRFEAWFDTLQEGDALLVKGSRGIALERVVQRLEQRARTGVPA